MDTLNISTLNTPCYVIEEALLKKNLNILHSVMQKTGCKVLLAQKAFSMYASYPLLSRYLSGTTASSLFEARLGAEEFGGETHIFSPAYKESEFDDILSYCNHIVFNSPAQWKKYKSKVALFNEAFYSSSNITHKKPTHPVSCGLRINPEYAEIETDMYNPCFSNSRLGSTLSQIQEADFEGIEGLHFHTMCEQNSDVLKRTLEVVEQKFGSYMHKMKWINFGGGHHITREDYDINTLIECIERVQNDYQVQVYLEPGEAVALNAGFLISEVLEIQENGMQIAILDTSAACHMPDVLEMPYRPEIIGAGKPQEKPYTYRLGGPTCLAGDVIGDYSFDKPLTIGDKLIFCDMAIYSMVKNNTFNGINLPDIVYLKENNEALLLHRFGYEDFKGRLS